MNIDFNPFPIGEQYENWEFDLEPVKTTKTYDQYLYIKNEPKEILNVPLQKILLTFNLDILFQVEYYFEAKYFYELKNKLIEYLSTSAFKENLNRLEWVDNRITIYLEKPLQSENTILRILDKRFVGYL